MRWEMEFLSKKRINEFMDLTRTRYKMYTSQSY